MGLAKRCSEFIQSPLISTVNCAGEAIAKLTRFPETPGTMPLLEGRILAVCTAKGRVTVTATRPSISKEVNAASPDCVTPGWVSAAITVDFATYTGTFCLSTVTVKRLESGSPAGAG